MKRFLLVLTILTMVFASVSFAEDTIAGLEDGVLTVAM